MNKIEIFKQMAEIAYAHFNAVDWANPISVKANAEASRKILSNTFLACQKSKYESSQYFSHAALTALNGNCKAGSLVFEHVVPKGKFINHEIEKAAREGVLTVGLIYELLQKYWIIATITKEEDSLLKSKDMPMEFYDPNHPLYNDLFARYKIVDLHLIAA